ncbi:MAG: hypothetical protein QM472_10865, partial [Spirochaetota bacterium]|nr:hypothetical protein [Spirochaetota bacterium]
MDLPYKISALHPLSIFTRVQKTLGETISTSSYFFSDSRSSSPVMRYRTLLLTASAMISSSFFITANTTGNSCITAHFTKFFQIFHDSFNFISRELNFFLESPVHFIQNVITRFFAELVGKAFSPRLRRVENRSFRVWQQL